MIPHVIRRRIRSLLGHDYSTYGVGIVPKYVAETYDSMLYCKTVEYSQIDRSKKSLFFPLASLREGPSIAADGGLLS